MNILNAIKKATKVTGQAPIQKGQFFHFEYKGYDISFAVNGRYSETAEATNYYTRKIGFNDDLQTDYFAGTFWDNLTQCFNFIDKLK